MKKICYTMDTEGDSAVNSTTSYYGIEKVLPKILKLYDLYNVKATFFIQEDKYVQLASRYPDLLEALHSKGHEIGYHAHGLIGASKENQQEIITDGITKLRDMGYKPVSFRAGRYHFNAQILKILEKNSIEYDSSVMPGLNEVVNGVEWNNHVSVSHTPYFPSYDDHRKKGNSKILEIPINRIRTAGSDYGKNRIINPWRRPGQELFDDFYTNTEDNIIIVSIHPWEGINRPFHRFNYKFETTHKKRYGYMAKLVATGLRIFGNLVNKTNLKGFGELLNHMSQKDIEFVQLKTAGELYKKKLSENK